MKRKNPELLWKVLFKFEKGDTVKFRRDVDRRLLIPKERKGFPPPEKRSKVVCYGVIRRVIKNKEIKKKWIETVEEVYDIEVLRPKKYFGKRVQVALEELKPWKPRIKGVIK